MESWKTMMKKLDLVGTANSLLVKHGKGTLEENEESFVLTFYDFGWLVAMPALRQIKGKMIYPSFINGDVIQYQFVVEKADTAWRREKQLLHLFSASVMAVERFADGAFSTKK